MKISAKWLIIVMGCISTGASLAGGLIMYYEALDILEKTVKDLGRADVQSLAQEMGQWFGDTSDTLLKYHDVLTRYDKFNGNSTEFESYLRETMVAEVYRDRTISTLGLRGYHRTTQEIFYLACWYDVLRQPVGGKSYVWADHFSGTTARAYNVNPATALVNRTSQLYDINLNVRNDTVFTDHPLGTRIWKDQQIWFVDNPGFVPYNYIPFLMTFELPNHSVLDEYNLILAVDMMTDQWGDLLDNHSTPASIVITQVNKGQDSSVLTGNFLETRVNASKLNPSPVVVRDLGVFSDLIMTLESKQPDVVERASNYWMMKSRIYEQQPADDMASIYLMWFRSVNSINSQMNRALWMLIAFVLGIFLFDTSLGIGEVLLIAQPLAILADTTVPMTKFDLDAAERIIASSRTSNCFSIKEVTHVREGIEFALESLQEYKTFLPRTIFYSESDMDTISSHVPVPGRSGVCAIVFTDIQSSTATWEQCPNGMRTALHLHNKVLRRCLDAHNGYEVKTIGDAFMVAFEGVADACNFGLASQLELQAADWPEEILALPQCSCDEDLWAGPRVRIGVHYGEVDVEMNSITGRYDFFGQTVNKAARVEGVCAGGAVAVTREVLDKLGANPLTSPLRPETQSAVLSELLDTPIAISMGMRTLRGVAGSSLLTALVPDKLKGRRKSIETEIRNTNATPIERERDAAVGIDSESRSNRAEDEMAALGITSASSASAASVSSASVWSRARSTALSNPLRERLDKVASLTVARVDLKFVMNIVEEPDDPLGLITEEYGKVLGCIERCEGVLMTAYGSTFLTTWNASKRCSAHLRNALRFVTLLRSRFANSQTEAFAGVCTGTCLVGNVSVGLGIRTSTVIGPVMNLTAYLTDSAVDFSLPALFCSLVPRPAIGIKTFIRPIDEWEVKCRLIQPTVVVYEIRMFNLEDSLVDLILGDCGGDSNVAGTAFSWGWSEAYYKAFYEKSFEKIRAQASTDPILKIVAEMIQSNKHLRRPVKL
eukprot:TRINITY_DN8605_c0_g1_i1.p1 TRINITY_DN8605_c0_g1~~TRINITY_DN8605_c0_g1_i1.p1  ORF type:complete len:1002 (+),score=81.10 TRINITY_DN8605_c0_g1_i1:75-3080(+)